MFLLIKKEKNSCFLWIWSDYLF